MSPTLSDNVITLESRRAQRATLENLREVESLLSALRQRLQSLSGSGELYDAPGTREGRRLLRIQQLLLEARSCLLEVTGRGPLPPPRLASTRERLLARALKKRQEAEQRLAASATLRRRREG
ncbi:MAG TPA: hypothetical protein VK013_11105 [Myxococcaceae bacterium]|nr:hypothetical protein [Myxococcaceae bacterium]